MKTVVLDVETIADQHAMARCGYQAEEGVFAPWPLHELVCASVLTVRRPSNSDLEFKLESVSRGTTNERGIVASVEKAINDADRILTYNGKAFDVPVLLARAIVAGEFVPTLARLGHRCRPGLHQDLHDDIKGAGGGIKLVHFCAPFGIPAKVGGAGDDVAALAEAGRWRDIEEYCESDVVATWIAAQMWESSEDPGIGHERWERIAAWLATECPGNARLAPFVEALQRGSEVEFQEASY